MARDHGVDVRSASSPTTPTTPTTPPFPPRRPLPTGLRRAYGEVRFVVTLWRANLLAALEYRTSFVSQILGMLLNNAAFLAFWVLFFERFPTVNGWGMRDMLQLYGMTATGFGLGVVLFGNALTLADVIAGNGLDGYLVLPRPVLLHVLAGRSRISGLGDIATGVVCYAMTGRGDPAGWGRYALASVLSMTVFVSFLVIVASLSFWLGGASALSAQAVHALLAFATYPLSIFDGAAKLMLLTVIPAGFIGAVPAAFVRGYSPRTLLELAGAAAVSAALATLLFHRGLRRYESGGMSVSAG